MFIRANNEVLREFHFIQVQKEMTANLLSGAGGGGDGRVTQLWTVSDISIAMLCFGPAFPSVYKEPQSFPGRKILKLITQSVNSYNLKTSDFFLANLTLNGIFV